MLKKGLITLAIIAIAIVSVSAQQVDRVILKSGSVIKGNIIKAVPTGEVTIEDRAGNRWVFPMEEVQEIEKTDDTETVPVGQLPAGLVNITTIGFLPGSQNSQYIAPFSMQTSFGYRTTMGLYSGLLTGLEFLNINHIPVMLDLQYSLRETGAVPVIIARGGYTLPSKYTSESYGNTFTYRGGVTGALGMGLKISTRENFAWDVSLLYRYMQINYTEEYEYQSGPTQYKDVYNRLEIRLGFYLGMQQ